MTFFGEIGDKVKPHAVELIAHTVVALISVLAIAGLHWSVGHLAKLLEWSPVLWDHVPVSWIFDAGHGAVLVRWVVNCVKSSSAASRPPGPAGS